MDGGLGERDVEKYTRRERSGDAVVDVRLAASGVGKSRRGGEELRGEGGEYPCIAGAVAEEFVVGVWVHPCGGRG